MHCLLETPSLAPAAAVECQAAARGKLARKGLKKSKVAAVKIAEAWKVPEQPCSHPRAHPRRTRPRASLFPTTPPLRSAAPARPPGAPAPLRTCVVSPPPRPLLPGRWRGGRLRLSGRHSACRL